MKVKWDSVLMQDQKQNNNKYIYIVFGVFRLNHISLHRSKKLGSYTVFCLNNVISVYSREQYTLFLLSFKLRKGKLLIINLINY